MKQIKYRTIKIIVWVLGVLIFIFLIVRPFEKSGNRVNRIMSNKVCNGRVVEKFINYENHGDPTFKLNDNSYFSWGAKRYTARGYYNLISVGDSIVKKTDNLILEVHKKDTTHYLDFTFETNSQ